MPDWTKVAGGRAENAVKALGLLVNTAGKGYEFTEQAALDMFADIDEALIEAKKSYVERVPEILDKDTVVSVPVQDHMAEPTSPDFIAITTSRAGPGVLPTQINTGSDMPLVVPHWAQIKDFVTVIPPNQLPAYILHIGDRMYEGALELSQK